MAARAEFQHLDDRMRNDRSAGALDQLFGARTVEVAQPDARINERRVAATRKKCALENLGQQLRRRCFRHVIERGDRHWVPETLARVFRLSETVHKLRDSEIAQFAAAEP